MADLYSPRAFGTLVNQGPVAVPEQLQDLGETVPLELFAGGSVSLGRHDSECRQQFNGTSDWLLAALSCGDCCVQSPWQRACKARHKRLGRDG